VDRTADKTQQGRRPLPIGNFSIVDESGELDAAELGRSVRRLAGGFYQLGIGPGVGVGVMCRNHRMFVQASRAAVMSGADVYYLSTEYSASELSRIIQHTGINALVYDGEFADRTQNLTLTHALVAWPCGGIKSSIDELLSGDYDTPRDIAVGQQILFTSGTEGVPKAAARSRLASREGIQAFLSRIPIGRGGTTVCAVPLYHAWGLLHLRLGLELGTRLVLPLTADPYTILEAINAARPRVIVTTPTILQSTARVAAQEGAGITEAAVDALRVIAVAGSALPPGLVDEAGKVFGNRLYCIYGSTEAGWVSAAAPDDLSHNPHTAGPPFTGVDAVITDSAGQACAPGTVGHICVRSDVATEGPALGSSELVDTGDLGYFDQSGRLFVVGRADDMLVVGGENVYPAEIEKALIDSPHVADAAVVGEPDQHFGQVPVAYVVRADGAANVSAEELQSWLRGQIAYSKIPREIIFMGRLPRNPTGKVLKNELADAASRAL
jgi:acyl-CoA synthetase (AMP-forming)/AMP-acid ligase II